MQSQKTWYLMVPGLFHGQKLRGPTPERTSFSPGALLAIARLKSAKNLYLQHRFFAEIRREKDRLRGPEFLSLKAASCLSKFTQTWREKSANSSDMVYFSGKSFRHGEKIRRAAGAQQLAPPVWRETHPLAALSHKKPGIHTK